MTERLPFHFSLSGIGEGNGNPLQCSCLENPRDRGAWWAAVYGVAQSRTQLKRLSSSSSRKEVQGSSSGHGFQSPWFLLFREVTSLYSTMMFPSGLSVSLSCRYLALFCSRYSLLLSLVSRTMEGCFFLIHLCILLEFNTKPYTEGDHMFCLCLFSQCSNC